MSDLISREDALNCFHDWIDSHGDVHTADEMPEYQRIEQWPSAQPDRPEQPESAWEYCAECDHIEMCRWYPYEGCEFRSLPSTEPKTGKWIPTQNPQWKAYYHDKCSVCGWWNTKNSVCRDAKKKAHSLNYCPNCGCRMKEGE